MSKPVIAACIPAYNEEKMIGSVIVRALKHVDFVVVCDDGSNDLTADIAEGLGASVVKHERNLGKGAALQTAFQVAKKVNPDVVVMLDGDGQHEPDYIPRIVDPVIMGKADIVVGSRFIEGSSSDMPLYRRFGLKILNFIVSRRINNNIIDTQSGFRALSPRAFEVLQTCGVEHFGLETEQLMLAHSNGLTMFEVPVHIPYSGLDKTSKKNPVSQSSDIIGTILRLIIEERPLLLLGVPGFLSLIVGLGTGTYFLWWFNTTREFSLSLALIAMGGVLFGTLLMIASLILYSLARVRERTPQATIT